MFMAIYHMLFQQLQLNFFWSYFSQANQWIYDHSSYAFVAQDESTGQIYHNWGIRNIDGPGKNERYIFVPYALVLPSQDTFDFVILFYHNI